MNGSDFPDRPPPDRSPDRPARPPPGRPGSGATVRRPRLFVGLRPPRPIRAVLLGSMGGVEGARWQDDGQLHLTVRFIGNVAPEQALAIAATLETLPATLAAGRAEPVRLVLRGVGRFGRNGERGVLWAGVEPSAGLLTLHGAVDEALLRAGLEPQAQPYRPHVTLARLGRRSGPVADFLATRAGLRCPAFVASELVLFESHTGPAGSIYRPLRRYRLGAPLPLPLSAGRRPP